MPGIFRSFIQKANNTYESDASAGNRCNPESRDDRRLLGQFVKGIVLIFALLCFSALSTQAEITLPPNISKDEVDQAARQQGFNEADFPYFAKANGCGSGQLSSLVRDDFILIPNANWKNANPSDPLKYSPNNYPGSEITTIAFALKFASPKETISVVEACNTHDLCYTTLGVTKKYCDTNIHQNLLSICRSQAKADYQLSCNWLADLYFVFIRDLGEKYYCIAQKKQAEFEKWVGLPVQIKISVSPTKADGRPWDSIVMTPPDPVLEILTTIAGREKRFWTLKCRDSYSCIIDNVYLSTSNFTINAWDLDIPPFRESIGRTSSSSGCRLNMNCDLLSRNGLGQGQLEIKAKVNEPMPDPACQ